MSPHAPQSWQVDADHHLRQARQRPSAHHDARPDPADISLLVIHAIALPPETFGGDSIDALFMGALDCDAHPYFETLRGVRVSAHAVIFRDGSVNQYVAFDRRAWHAGVSQWRGRERCNDFSIGVELEGSPTQPFTAAQYQSLVALSQALLARYPRLSTDTIAGHADIAPGRKVDPGPHFDWLRYRRTLAQALGQTQT